MSEKSGQGLSANLWEESVALVCYRQKYARGWSEEVKGVATKQLRRVKWVMRWLIYSAREKASVPGTGNSNRCHQFRQGHTTRRLHTL